MIEEKGGEQRVPLKVTMTPWRERSFYAAILLQKEEEKRGYWGPREAIALKLEERRRGEEESGPFK